MGNKSCVGRCDEAVHEAPPEQQVPAAIESSWQEEVCPPDTSSTPAWQLPMRRGPLPRTPLPSECPGKVKIPLLAAIKEPPEPDHHYPPAVDMAHQPLQTASEAAKSESQPCRVQVELQPGEDLGLQLTELTGDSQSGAEGALLVTVVERGAIAHAFTSSGSSPCLLPGDTVVQVSDRPGEAADLRARLENIVLYGGILGLSVCKRPATFSVELYRSGPLWHTFGMRAVIDKADADRIQVVAIFQEGLVPTWNAAHGLLQVLAGDSITQVNGIAKSAYKMWAEMRAAGEGSTLQLRVETPPRQ